MGETVKICPSEDELSIIQSEIFCMATGCKMKFKSQSNLNMHVLKHHKGEKLVTKNEKCEYYCPIGNCLYSLNTINGRHFAKYKYVKQHFQKLHLIKEKICSKCCKGFSTDASKRAHEKICGKVFRCCCGNEYNTSEALLTHIRRKGSGHAVDNPEVKDKVIEKSMDMSSCGSQDKEGKTRLIYPKLGADNLPFSVQYFAAIALSELSTAFHTHKGTDRGVQTDTADECVPRNKKNVHYVKVGERKRKNSQQTQTVAGKCKKLKISTETQTNSEYLKNRKHGSKTPPRKRKKSMETQTKDVVSLKKEKKDFNFKDIAFLDNDTIDTEMFIDSPNTTFTGKGLVGSITADRTKQWIWQSQEFAKTEQSVTTVSKEMFTSDTELQIGQSTDCTVKKQRFDSRLCNIETQTEVDPLLSDCNEETSFTLCSTTETQTTDDFLLYSNMCTQTCEDTEVDQLFNFNLVDIETQTAWPDLTDYTAL